MSLRRAFTIAACLMPLAASAAFAQWPAPQQQQAPAGAWPAPSAQPAPSAPSAQPAPSVQAAPPAAAWPAPSQQGIQAPQQQGFLPSPQMQMQQQQQEPPCFKEFMTLRTETEKRGKALQEAGKRKVPPGVACKLFTDFVSAENKLVKYATANADACQIPKQAIDTLTSNNAKSTEVRAKVCQAAAAAAAPPKPRGPSLSDALSAPVPDSGNIKTGRGTFDTLTGSPLAR